MSTTSSPPGAPTKHRLGSVLLDMGLITPEDLSETLAQQRNEGGRLGEILVASKRLSPEQVAQALARRLGIEYAALAEAPDPAIAGLLDDQAAHRYLAIPLRRDPDGVLVVAMADPKDLTAIDDLQMLLREQIRPVLTMPESVMAYVGAGAAVEEFAADLKALSRPTGPERLPWEPDIAVGENDGPVIRCVNSVIARAVSERASDIHMEPQERELVVRFRVDGVMRTERSWGPVVLSETKAG